MKNETTTNGGALPSLPFPIQAGDRAEFEASSAGHTDFNGACRVLSLYQPKDDFPPTLGTVFACMCLNGGTRNGQHFPAYESELSK